MLTGSRQSDIQVEFFLSHGGVVAAAQATGTFKFRRLSHLIFRLHKEHTYSLYRSRLYFFVYRVLSSIIDMPRGKKSRKIIPCRIHGILNALFLGHFKPRNLNRYLDICVVKRGVNDPLFRNLAVNVQYPYVLGLDSLYSRLYFKQSPTVNSMIYAQRIQEIVETQVDLVLIQASSNDLSKKNVCIDSIVNRVIDSMLHVVNHGQVKSDFYFGT